MAGPLEATAGSCGCPVSPGVLERGSGSDSAAVDAEARDSAGE
ncbi:hypothetical protein [Halopiger djelfimassiliensis]|nr:hypothetical protein [Halopiger djelfimassiliensis]